MENIRYFLKFGKKKYLQDLIEQKLYFNNALALRGIEENLKIKGQGDKLEGSAKLFATNATMISNDGAQIIDGIRGIFTVHFGPVNKTPVFCLFSVFDEDCTVDEDGNTHITLSPEKKTLIREHFPSADAVVVITNPEIFLQEIADSIGTDCKMGQVRYFNIDQGFSVEGSKTPAMDMEFMRYLTQDITPVVEGGMKKYTVRVEHAFRSLFCKDVFFAGEQEYRIILHNDEISEAKKYPVHFSEQLSIYDLESFMANH